MIYAHIFILYKMKVYGLIEKKMFDTPTFSPYVFTNLFDAVKHLKDSIPVVNSSIREMWSIRKLLQEEPTKSFKIADMMDSSYNIISEYYLFETDL